MKATLLKVAGLLLALPLALVPFTASAYDCCAPAYRTSHVYHGGRQAMVWPGDACRGAYYTGGHTRYVAQPVVLVRSHRVAPAVIYRSHVGYQPRAVYRTHAAYSYRAQASTRRGRHY